MLSVELLTNRAFAAFKQQYYDVNGLDSIGNNSEAL